MKKCPYCAEEIQDEAIKCKHCLTLLLSAAPSVPNAPLPQAAPGISSASQGDSHPWPRFLAYDGLWVVMRPGFWKVADTFDLYEGERGQKVGSAFVEESAVLSVLRVFTHPVSRSGIGIRVAEDKDDPKSPSIFVAKDPPTLQYAATVRDWWGNAIGGYSKTFAWGSMAGIVINDAAGATVARWAGESFVAPSGATLFTAVTGKYDPVPNAQVSLFIRFDREHCTDPILRALLLGVWFTSKIRVIEGGLIK